MRRVILDKESLFQVEPDNVYTEELVHVQHAVFALKGIVGMVSASHDSHTADSVAAQLQDLASVGMDNLDPELQQPTSSLDFLFTYRNLVGLSAAYSALQALGHIDRIKDDSRISGVVAKLDGFASQLAQHPLLQHETVALFKVLTSSHDESDVHSFVKEYALLTALTMSNVAAGSLPTDSMPPASSEEALLQPSLVLGLPVMTADSPFGESFPGMFTTADVQDIAAAFDVIADSFE